MRFEKILQDRLETPVEAKLRLLRASAAYPADPARCHFESTEFGGILAGDALNLQRNFAREGRTVRVKGIENAVSKAKP